MNMHPTFARAALGGVVGTLAMTFMMYVVAPMMGLQMDIAAMLGSMLGGSWGAGLMMHVVNGTLIFPAIYAYALYAHLPASPAVRGTIWGVVLWLIAQTMVMPMMGAGLFSSAMGGAMAAMGSLISHILYGSLLGVVASSPEPRVAHA
jgi:uncharacterized protein DUF6789